MSITHNFEVILNGYTRYDAPHVNVKNFTATQFAEHTIEAVKELVASENIGFNLEVLTNVDVTKFDEETYEGLVRLRNVTSSAFSTIVAVIQDHYRLSDKLAKQYVSIRDSKNGHTQKSQERLAEILAQQEHEHQEASGLKLALLSTMRAEHAIRGIPGAYKTGNVEDYFNVFKLTATVECTLNTRNFIDSYLNRFAN